MKQFSIFFLVLHALSSWVNTVDADAVGVPDAVLASKLRTALGLGGRGRYHRHRFRKLNRKIRPY